MLSLLSHTATILCLWISTCALKILLVRYYNGRKNLPSCVCSQTYSESRQSERRRELHEEEVREKSEENTISWAHGIQYSTIGRCQSLAITDYWYNMSHHFAFVFFKSHSSPSNHCLLSGPCYTYPLSTPPTPCPHLHSTVDVSSTCHITPSLPMLWNGIKPLSYLLHLIIVWSCGHYYKVQGWTHVGHMVNTLISFHLIPNAAYICLSFYLLYIAAQCLMVTTCCCAMPHL